MKKLFTIILLFIVIGVNAQVNSGHFSGGNRNGIDTIFNSQTLGQSLLLPGYWSTLTIQVHVEKISGTINGTLKLFGSLDNDGGTQIGDTVALSDTSGAYYTFSVNPSIYSSYFAVLQTSGTMVATYRTFWLARRETTQKQN